MRRQDKGELYRLLDTDAPIDYVVYKPEEVEERLALGDPFCKSIQKGKSSLWLIKIRC